MTKESSTAPPIKKLPDSQWEHFALYESVREAIATLPIYFRTETHISGIMATDLHTLNTVLGATIEEQVVRTLNLIRSTWDPKGQYALYSFVRSPQTFPDVRLKKATGNEVLLGIELKGWYLLAKEAEPSLRFQATAAACALEDLLVVVPWVLGNVISGSPILFEPFVESAKHAAEFRNYHWQHLRESTHPVDIVVPVGAVPYPSKPDQISDKPTHRTGMMDAYMAKLNDVSLCGIKAVFWRQFLKAFQESTTDVQARTALERLRRRVQEAVDFPSGKAQAALAIVAELGRLLDLPS